MQDRFVFSPLHLNDAARLRQAGFLPDAQHTLAVHREYLRRFLEVCGRGVWLAAGEDGQVQAVAGFQDLDLTNQRALLHLLKSEKSEISPACMQAIAQMALSNLGIYRLELNVLTDDQVLLTAIASSGLRPEGNLANGLYDSETKRHHDIVLYSIIRPWMTGQGAAFVPFSKGIYALAGSDTALNEAELIHFGGLIRSEHLREAAEILDLLDNNGNLLSRQALVKRLAGNSCLVSAEAPEIIRQAAQQVVDYLAGSRSTFDLAVNLSHGSEFQVKVWNKLAEIPFGTTWTYEELAHSLAPGDWQAARKMARAVGAACSSNPLPLILPCHRVIGKDGRLVGFSSGLDMKEYLLAHEMMGINE